MKIQRACRLIAVSVGSNRRLKHIIKLVDYSNRLIQIAEANMLGSKIRNRTGLIRQLLEIKV